MSTDKDSEKKNIPDVSIDSLEHAVRSDEFNWEEIEQNPFPGNEDVDPELEEAAPKHIPPVVSVVMPVYNHERFVGAAISSVLVQDFTNFELIIVNDCSSDHSEEQIKAFSDSRIVYIADGIKRGVSGAKTRGLGEARGRYIAFIDSDDVWLQGKLRDQIRHMRAENCTLSFCDYIQIDEHGNKISEAMSAPLRVDYQTLLRYANYIKLSTAMIDFSKIHDFRFPELNICEDYAFWMKILRETNTVAVRVPKIYAQCRIHRGALAKGKLKIASAKWHIWRTYEEQSYGKSLGHLIRHASSGKKTHS